jgi:hypothetical protein
MEPEQRLALAVIIQAITDYFLEERTRARWRKRNAAVPRNGQTRELRNNSGAALSFLTAKYGPWAQARADWCDAANICPARLRKNVLVMIERAQKDDRFVFRPETITSTFIRTQNNEDSST